MPRKHLSILLIGLAAIFIATLFLMCGPASAQSSPEGPNSNQTAGPPMKAFEMRLFRDGSGNVEYICIAPSRGKTSSITLTAATAATPVVYTTSAPHGLNPGYIVTVSGVTGNTGANTTGPILVVDSTHFSITGSVGTGAGTGGTATTQAPLMTDAVWAIKRMYYTVNDMDASVWLNGNSTMSQICANRTTIGGQ